ncbi:MAG: zinc ribbon domain-containing protein [Candidatus Edwardsbacteria bacterium]|nr:zinc ribbon domain-containing protein [Candidatus Edwardsbacteria bacterium]
MPIYEYECQGCKKRIGLLILSPSACGAPKCPKCGSAALERLMSRFGTFTSDEKRMEKMSDPSSFSGLDENDPSSVARWAKRMGKEMGEDVGEDFDGMVDQAAEEEDKKGASGTGDELY